MYAKRYENGDVTVIAKRAIAIPVTAPMGNDDLAVTLSWDFIQALALLEPGAVLAQTTLEQPLPYNLTKMSPAERSASIRADMEAHGLDPSKPVIVATSDDPQDGYVVMQPTAVLAGESGLTLGAFVIPENEAEHLRKLDAEVGVRKLLQTPAGQRVMQMRDGLAIVETMQRSEHRGMPIARFERLASTLATYRAKGAGRGAGMTSLQMLIAKPQAVFVIPSQGGVHYWQQLAQFLDRTDLRFRKAHDVRPHMFLPTSGLPDGQIVIDHAAQLREDSMEKIRRIVEWLEGKGVEKALIGSSYATLEEVRRVLE